MSESEKLFSVLRSSADASAVSALETLVREGQDRALSRINALDFAALHRRRKLVEPDLGVTVHAAGLEDREEERDDRYQNDQVDEAVAQPLRINSGLQRSLCPTTDDEAR